MVILQLNSAFFKGVVGKRGDRVKTFRLSLNNNFFDCIS